MDSSMKVIKELPPLWITFSDPQVTLPFVQREQR